MSIDTGVTYTITAPASVDGRGEVAQLNGAVTDTHFVGWLLDVSGFDSPEVRESADNLVEGDGGVHGSFYYGRRPFTLEIVVKPAATTALSHARLDKLFRATNAMRADGTIVWTETGGVAKRLLFRRQQPLRFTQDGRRCLLAGVSADARITSNTENSDASATSHTVTNAGNAGALPRLTIASPSATVNITNTTTSETLTFTGLNGGGAVTIDFAAHTITQGGVSKLSAVSFPSSVWWELAPGSNTVTTTDASVLYWRDSWL